MVVSFGSLKIQFLHAFLAQTLKSNNYYDCRRKVKVLLYTEDPASDLFEPQLHLILVHLFTLRFKYCSECGSCKQRHEKSHR